MSLECLDKIKRIRLAGLPRRASGHWRPIDSPLQEIAMSLRASPIKPGRSYMIHHDGKELAVIAGHPCDALLWYMNNIMAVA